MSRLRDSNESVPSDAEVGALIRRWWRAAPDEGACCLVLSVLRELLDTRRKATLLTCLTWLKQRLSTAEPVPLLGCRALLHKAGAAFRRCCEGVRWWRVPRRGGQLEWLGVETYATFLENLHACCGTAPEGGGVHLPFLSTSGDYQEVLEQESKLAADVLVDILGRGLSLPESFTNTFIRRILPLPFMYASPGDLGELSLRASATLVQSLRATRGLDAWLGRWQIILTSTGIAVAFARHLEEDEYVRRVLGPVWESFLALWGRVEREPETGAYYVEHGLGAFEEYQEYVASAKPEWVGWRGQCRERVSAWYGKHEAVLGRKGPFFASGRFVAEMLGAVGTDLTDWGNGNSGLRSVDPTVAGEAGETTRGSPGMERQIERRLRDLQDGLAKDLKLLREYEDKIRSEGDPAERLRCEGWITKLRNHIAAHEREFRQVEDSAASRPGVPARVRDALDEIRALLVSLGKGQRDIKEGLDNLRAVLLKRFEESERSIVSRILERLDEDQVRDLSEVVAFVDDAGLGPRLLEEFSATAKEVVAEAVRRRRSLPDASLRREVSNLRNAVNDPNLDVRHKIKLSVPIIPLLLSYNVEFELKSGLNLTRAWDWFVKASRKKPPGTLPPSP